MLTPIGRIQFSVSEQFNQSFISLSTGLLRLKAYTPLYNTTKESKCTLIKLEYTLDKTTKAQERVVSIITDWDRKYRGITFI